MQQDATMDSQSNSQVGESGPLLAKCGASGTILPWHSPIGAQRRMKYIDSKGLLCVQELSVSRGYLGINAAEKSATKAGAEAVQKEKWEGERTRGLV